MKYKDWFIVVLLQVVIAILVVLCWVWLVDFPLSIAVNMVDAISIWAAVITIVFLVFSVMGLMNIDRKMDELDRVRLQQENRFREIEEKSLAIIQSSEEAKRDIVVKAEEQIGKIVGKSTSRINFFDRLSSILRDPMVDRQILGFTNLLREMKEVDGIDFAYIYMNRGHAYLSLKKTKEAFADFEMAIKVCQDINKESAYSSMGDYYVAIKDYEKSIDYYCKALEYNPQSASLCMCIGNSLSKLRRFDEAETYYLNALTFNPEMAEIYYNKSVRLKDEEGCVALEQSMAYLDKCIQINPLFIRAYINKAALYRECNKELEAAEVLDKVVATVYNEDFLMAVLQRGIAYRMTNNIPLALNDFLFVLTFDSNNVQNLSNLASVYFAMGNFVEAQYYARLGLAQSEKQDKHFCDKEMQEILSRISFHR